MPAETMRLFLFWGPRQESAEACAARLAQMLTRLAQIDPVYSRWFEQTETREAASQPFCVMPPEVSELARIFDREPVYENDPRLRPENGFSAGAWNGQDKPYAATFSAFAGSYALESRVPNRVMVSIPACRLADGRPWNASDVKQVLLAAVEAWDAVYAVVFSRKMDRFVPRGTNNYCIWPFAAG